MPQIGVGTTAFTGIVLDGIFVEIRIVLRSLKLIGKKSLRQRQLLEDYFL